jgi:hypothetical protein
VGQDPFRTPLIADLGEEPVQDGTPHVESESAVAEVVDFETSGGPLSDWFERVRTNDETLRKTLKVLVQHDVMTREEARAVYRGALAAAE